MSRWLLCVGLLLLAGCQQMSVTTDYDPYANLEGYRTFDWMAEKPVELSGDQQLLHQQLKYTVEQNLLTKGIVRETRSPDFYIGYYGSSEQKITQRVVEHGDIWSDKDRYDHGRRELDKSDPRLWRYPPEERERIYYTRSVETQDIRYTEGTLVIDFIDAATRKVVWQSTIQGVLSQNKPMASIANGVHKALAQFPPTRSP